ncbi:MAG: hypothetical protein M3126_09040 [Candidatus Eremiobacteraeota bacterium]|nr:hypothetical protein [Candidatus Eremiobacteraeota bacterium]
MLWALSGLVLSVLTGAMAMRAAGRGDASHASEVYGMTPASHRRFAAACAFFAAIFALAAAWPLIPAVAVFGAFVLALILYGSSFLRGYADEDA